MQSNCQNYTKLNYEKQHGPLLWESFFIYHKMVAVEEKCRYGPVQLVQFYQVKVHLTW